MYLDMESYFSGLNFHAYILDFDKDGYLDFVLPNFVSNRLEIVANPGLQYWNRVTALKDRFSTQKERLQSEIAKSVEKWKEIKLVEPAARNVVIKDFVFVNIDNERKLVIVVLGGDSIRKNNNRSHDLDWFYPYTDYSHNRTATTRYREVVLNIDGKTSWGNNSMTSLYDVDVSNSREA